jgi:DNA-binding response OmpR family regulator
MKILIVEDDEQLNTAIVEFCDLHALNAMGVKDGFEAIEAIDNHYFDLYVIDINLPNVNGLEIITYIRQKDLQTPIIIITASLEIQSVLTAYDNGCNEYMKKPFHLKELYVRIQYLLKLYDLPESVTFPDDLVYDFTQEAFIHKGELIPLRHKEKRLCFLLMKNMNHLVKSETIYDYVWEGETKEAYPLRQLLSELRRKLPYEVIVTKVKAGYTIENPIKIP